MGRKIYYIETICDGCGKTFDKDKREYNRCIKMNTRQFCSRECFHNSKITAVTVVCTNCNKPITKRQSELVKNENCFCSRSCSIAHNNKKRVGELHPNWTNSPREYRRYALLNKELKCYFCDYDVESVLQIHHKDGDRANNDLENLVVVCPTHHVEIHRGLKVVE